jgi:hypothetical protein
MLKPEPEYRDIPSAIRSEVSFRSDMHNCFKAVVKQKGKKIRSHTLVARGVGPLRGTVLSVLKPHFDSACIGDCKQLLSKSGKTFVHTHWVQEGLGLSEVLCVRTVLFVGKCGVRFRRFKKGSRALATRAKTHCLDQNRQSLGYIARRSNH